MGQWVVSVAGIAILSVLCDVILPDGQTRKYIKTVIGIVVTVVMLQPIINLAGDLFNVEESSTSTPVVTIQQSYLDMVYDKQQRLQISNIKASLDARDIQVENIELNEKKKTAVVTVSSTRSNEKEAQIYSVVSSFYSDYEIRIEWT